MVKTEIQWKKYQEWKSNLNNLQKRQRNNYNQFMRRKNRSGSCMSPTLQSNKKSRKYKIK